MGDLTKDFSRWEFACPCGCGRDTIDYELVVHLQYERDYFDKAVTVTSGFRCEDHNRRVGGKRNSQHLYGRAADTVMSGVSPEKRYKYYQDRWPSRYGLGVYPVDSMLHVDTRTKGPARWRGDELDVSL